TTGSFNLATGSDALFNNTTGDSNTANGVDALFENTTGSNNTATGVGALYSNTTGNYNTANGAGALETNGGSYNTPTGYLALSGNLISVSSGSNNTATGYQALAGTTTGFNNTASGYQSLANNTTGVQNTASGQGSLYSNVSGRNNTAYGQSALHNNTTGSFNIAVGDNAGLNLTTGSNNIEIGNRGVAGEASTIRIGKQGMQTATFIAGISGTTVPTGVAVIVDGTGRLGTVTSSARFKEAIRPMDRASETILALQPVTFHYRHELDPAGIPQFGLIAEEVEKVNPDLVVRDDDGKAYTVRYEAVNAMLLNEFLKEHRKVQEQEVMITQLKAELQATAARQQKE